MLAILSVQCPVGQLSADTTLYLASDFHMSKRHCGDGTTDPDTELAASFSDKQTRDPFGYGKPFFSSFSVPGWQIVSEEKGFSFPLPPLTMTALVYICWKKEFSEGIMKPE